ncbi:hypothetical protein GCM10027275_50520 [Rhabdobacter roseus]|uniref:Uncharacterized protein n=1 Tax=Rhabdobacter roseus TaxID=1655419 RepID=A0A840TW25_9BACT|nr:hypothetical protein [Rhabdobacter roseus]MBB5287125.1 hypothetical protein [Rhabdobacter roseus]
MSLTKIQPQTVGPVKVPIQRLGPRGAKGWTPLLRAVSDGPRKLLELYDWTGGLAPKPHTGYVGPAGLVADLALALDFTGRGLASVAQDPEANLVFTYDDGVTETIPAYFAPVLAAAAQVDADAQAVELTRALLEALKLSVEGTAATVDLDAQAVEMTRALLEALKLSVESTATTVGHDAQAVELTRALLEALKLSVEGTAATVDLDAQAVEMTRALLEALKLSVEGTAATVDLDAQAVEQTRALLAALAEQVGQDKQAVEGILAAFEQLYGHGQAISLAVQQSFQNAVQSELALNLALVYRNETEQKRIEVNALLTQAAEIVFNGATDRPTIRPSFRWHRDQGVLDPRIELSYSGLLAVFDRFGSLRWVPASARALDYDPVTGACLGLPVFQGRANLLSSRNFTTGWGANAGGDVVFPLLIETDSRFSERYKLVPTASNGLHRIFHSNVTLVSGQAYALSVVARAGEYRYLSLRMAGAAGVPSATIVFDLIDKVATTATGLSTAIRDLGGGVLQCDLVGTAAANGTMNAYVGVSDVFTSNYPSWIADGTSGIYVYAVNLQTGGSSTPIIGAARGNILAQISGLALSQFFNPNEGTIVVEFISTAPVGDSTRMISFNSGGAASTGGHIQIATSSTAGQGSVMQKRPNGGVVQTRSLGTYVPGSVYKVAGAYDQNEIRASRNGSAVLNSNVAGSIGAIMRMELGAQAQDNFLNGWIRSIEFFPKKLPDSQLVALSRL